MEAAAVYARAKSLLATAGGLAEARRLLESASATNHAPAAFRLAELILEHDGAGGHDRAVALLRSAAEAGHARAAFRLGLLFATGQAGLRHDPTEAARWCELAADQGLAVAQFNLALLQAAGPDSNPETALRWLRLASVNGIAEADGCLEILYRDEADQRPRTWDEADTRASVALARTDPDRPKSIRFAEYYVDPCLDLLARRLRLRSDESDDIVQQFFLELEEPLAKGAFRGRAWKEALREAYDRGRGSFRPFLGRALVNFARDWLHRRDHPPANAPEAVTDDVECQRDRWSSLLGRFTAELAPQRADAERAVAVVTGVLAEDLDQNGLAARHGVSDRTIRTDMRLGAELLCEWVRGLVATLPGDGRTAQALRRGCELLPVWLHRPSAEKRARTLLFLALVERCTGQPDQDTTS